MKKQLTFFNSSIENLSQRISSGEISPVELIEASLSRIKELNQDYNAFITVTEDSAIQEAKQAIAEEIALRVGILDECEMYTP